MMLGAVVLVAGCWAANEQLSSPAALTPLAPSSLTSPPAAVPPTMSSSPTAPSPSASVPTSATPIQEVIKWIEAGVLANVSDYHIALRRQATTSLGDDIAFTTVSGISCMTDIRHDAPGLACLVDLVNPPPRPDTVYGPWKGGWVDFDGTAVAVGSVHGDPGRFTAGQGPQLPPEMSLSFSDYRCRSDNASLFCVNYAHHSAIRLADNGIDTYSCTPQSTAPAGIGRYYRC